MIPILTCMIADDEPSALRYLTACVKQTEGLKLIGTFLDSGEAQNALEKASTFPDILFLDIEMQDVGGIELAEMVLGKAMVVFTTAHEAFAVDSYKVEAIDFLLKPFEYERFRLAVEKCQKRWLADTAARQVGKHIHLKDSMKNITVKINPMEILYLKSFGNYTRLYLKGSEILVHKASIKIMEQAGADAFLPIHKSFVVRIGSVVSFDNTEMLLIDGTRLPIGPAFRKRIKEVFKVSKS